MNTEIIRIDIQNIDMDKIRHAAQVLKNGGLVAFPTETVYGLGANALNEKAVGNIFNAKGRPSDNPLIVHVSDRSEVTALVSKLPSEAEKLMDKFWPGPLTIIMNKSEAVPYAVTAGIETVAVRMPSHPVALSLIREAGVPVAAPSANSSGKPSPTSAEHVIDDLSSKVDVIVDAGYASVGLESTVIDLTSEKPVILRPGGVTLEQLESVLGSVYIDPAIMEKPGENLKPKSPGMKYKHYSPKAEVIVIEGKPEDIVGKIVSMKRDYESRGILVGILATDQTFKQYEKGPVISAGDRNKPETIANSLFAMLREFDSIGVGVILAEAVDTNGIGLAIMNRMNKAAGYHIIKA